jgi:hypothetical protein
MGSLRHMSERQKQAEFLKRLLATGETEAHRQLEARIAAAERDVRSMRHACKLVGLAALFALAALGYCAVLLPEYFDSSTPLSVRLLRALTLACGLSFLGFWGMTCWYRGLLHRLHDQARHLVTHFVLTHHQPAASPMPTVVVHEGDTAVYRIRTESHSVVSDTEFVSLPKAS